MSQYIIKNTQKKIFLEDRILFLVEPNSTFSHIASVVYLFH